MRVVIKPVRITCAAVAACVALSAPHLRGAVEGFDNGDCFICHDDETMVFDSPPRLGESLDVDPAAYAGSVHAELACIECHTGLDADAHPDGTRSPAVDCATCHEAAAAMLGQSPHHASAAEEDGARLPGCADCHGSHYVRSHLETGSSLHFLRVIDTCGACHEEVAAQVRASVHGFSEDRISRDAPVCTDCHVEHLDEMVVAAEAMALSGEVCAQCHASERLNSRYGITAGQVRGYQQSYHGLAGKLGATAVANCASCHGYHLILPSDDPRSTIHPENLVRTCGECHPGAEEKFVSGTIHHPDAKPGEGDFGAVVNHYVRIAYKVLIVAVIGLMLAHNGLEWRRQVVRHLRDPSRRFLRMSRPLRIQHALLAVSFVYLAISGFALAWPDSVFSWLLGNSEPFRQWSHRLVGVFLIVLGVFHVAYLAVTVEGRRLVADMLPGPRDLRDLAANIGYYLGLRDRRAAFGRFGYPEKIEYWAVFWGTIIMGLTGLMIWLKIPVTGFLPRWAIEVATSIHLYEAILAVLAILVWHMYHVILSPGSYPMNGSWLDGKVSREWLEEEHPRDPAARNPEEDAGRSG